MPSPADGPRANRVLEKMLDRLLASLVNGPGLNCRPHRSPQRVDFSALSKLLADARTVERPRVFAKERLVTAADPCQSHAVRLARKARGLVTHGPPGTGKSSLATLSMALRPAIEQLLGQSPTPDEGVNALRREILARSQI